MEQTLKVRKLIEKDWDFLPKWWEEYDAWNGHSIPREMLPGTYSAKLPRDVTEEEAKTQGLGGFIVCKGETPIAACWLVLANAGMCDVAPVIADKGYRDTDRKEAIELLIHFTTQFAADLGFKYAHAWSTHEGLTNIYTNMGYQGDACTELTIKI